jgi:uncharacterized protein DUF559
VPNRSSPIEAMLLGALIETGPQLGCEINLYRGWRSASEPPVAHSEDATYPAVCDPSVAIVGIFPDANLHGYRADLLVVLERKKWVTWLAVECDGHDWHERTQQQAAYDRARDRALLQHGVITIRFTGSEINRDANQCAREVLDSVRALHGLMVSHVVSYAGDLAREFIDKAVASIKAGG